MHLSDVRGRLHSFSQQVINSVDGTVSEKDIDAPSINLFKNRLEKTHTH